MASKEAIPNDGDYYLEKVSPAILSSDVFTPLQGPRPTQSSIGLFLKKKESIEDESLGTHYTCYGGVGKNKIPGHIARRDHNHLRTGIDPEISGPITERWKSILVERNNSFYAQPIQNNAHEIYDLTKDFYSQDQQRKKVKKSLFPRSIVYEIEYLKEQMHKSVLEALEKEIAENQGKMFKGKPNQEQASKPVTDQIGDVEQKKGEEKTKAESEQEDVSDELCQDLIWSQEEGNIFCSWGEEREKEFLKVGRPFRAEAARWARCNIGSLCPEIARRKGKKCFPVMAYSQIELK